MEPQMNPQAGSLRHDEHRWIQMICGMIYYIILLYNSTESEN